MTNDLGPKPLTPRETEIISFIAEGESIKTIAHRMGLSPRTVETHLFNIRNKTGARSTAHAAALFATRAGQADVA